jgi:ABC-type sulfate/molybdate transport systems ATPase subunit
MTILDLTDVTKDYGALRPLRIERLQIDAADDAAILGLDEAAAEVFTDLVTGATLPDRGEVRLLGRVTTSIIESGDWLAQVDRVGIVTERAVLLEAFSVTQNLAIPFTLDVDPPAGEIQARANALAAEARIPEAIWPRPLAEIDPASRLRVRFARALALDPAVVLLEHPTADLWRRGFGHQTRGLGRDMRRAVERRGAALIAVTADEDFARAVARRVLRLAPATGRVSSVF